MGKITPEEAKKKILRFCAYQERSHQEVRNKLFELGLYASKVDEILAFLITEGFLNEERFARAFAGGKFRMKKWGRLKITRELEQRNLSARCIRMGLKEIDEDDYRKTLADLLERKNHQLDEPDAFIRRDKLARFAIHKGYEPDLVWELVRNVLPVRS
jgi:regulatory protein